MAGRMHTVVGLHLVLEGSDVPAVSDEGSDLGRRGIALGEIVGDVAFHAAWVVAVAVAARVAGGSGVA